MIAHAPVRVLNARLGERKTPAPAAPAALAPCPDQPAPHPQRRAAIAADAISTESANLLELWRELARGSTKVVDSFFSADRCYLLLANNVGAEPIGPRRQEILEAVLSGLRQKNIAIDLGLAPSTVALNSRLALQSLGVSCRPSRAHPLLMLAARATAEAPPDVARSARFVSADGETLRVIGAPRPDGDLRKLLPSAELSVIRSLVEGFSYEEIAQLRGTSTRTIANQITAVFRRLRVSGRNELVQRLFFEGASIGAPPKRASETLVPSTGKGKPSWVAALRSA